MANVTGISSPKRVRLMTGFPDNLVSRYGIGKITHESARSMAVHSASELTAWLIVFSYQP